MTLLQVVTETAVQLVDTLAQQVSLEKVPPSDGLRIIDLLIKGGWVMIPILSLSVIGSYIFIERYIVIRKASKDPAKLLLQVKKYVSEGQLDTAISVCKNNDTPLGRMLLKGLSRLGRPIKDIEAAIENVGKLEVSKLERNVGILGIIAGIAPMFGFLGTISGVIRIFYQISLENNINIGTISGGLYEKMITSATGLLIGIVAYVGHHILNIMVDKVILKIETDAIEFIDLLEEPAK